MPLPPGTSIGPYETVAIIGSGAVGEVYKAWDPRLQREVAIKVLTPVNADQVKRFQNEARAAGGLHHPNIAGVYDVGETEGIPYIVSEFVDGESLRVLVERGSVATDLLLEIAVGVASALAEAHDAGITHRDLKPDNILLNRKSLPKIVDFG